MNGRWGFDEADDEFETLEAAEDTDASPELVTGQDAAGIVTIWVTYSAEVVSVGLVREWRSSVEPQDLHSSVAQAMNAATATVCAKQAEQFDMTGDELGGTGPGQVASNQSENEIPLTSDYVMQLLSAVSADVGQFVRQASAITAQSVTVESSGGGHVSISGARRQVSDVSLDTRWLSSARHSAIEAELSDALTGFTGRFSLGELAQGPRSPAISELMSLISDPEATISRIKQRRSS